MKKTIKLENGITLISHNLENTHSVTISICFKAGSIFEDNFNHGINHLIEHLFFRHLGDLSKDELYKKMSGIGAEISGVTNKDYVRFTITVVPKFYKSALMIMKKFLDDFDWNLEDVFEEKKLVVKQIENQSISFSEWSDYQYFGGTPYGELIMGDADSVNALTLSCINKWKREYFNPCNSCVVITGNFSEQDFDYCCKTFVSIKSFGSEKSLPIIKPNNFGSRKKHNRYTIFNADDENTEIVIYYDVSGVFDYEVVRLLISILGEGCTSILSKALRENDSITDDIFTDYFAFVGFSRISISLTVSNVDFEESIYTFFNLIKSLKKGISTVDYASSINFFTENQLMDYDNPLKLNSNYLLGDFILDSVITEPQKQKEKYEKISLLELNDCMSKIFDKNNLSLLVSTKLDAKFIKNCIENNLEE